MVRVTHGKFTKAVSKKMRPAEEEEPEEDVDMGDLFGGGDDDY